MLNNDSLDAVLQSMGDEVGLLSNTEGGILYPDGVRSISWVRGASVGDSSGTICVWLSDEEDDWAGEEGHGIFSEENFFNLTVLLVSCSRFTGVDVVLYVDGVCSIS